MRPIFGSPDLITNPSATPIGAIGQSLGELNERNKRAEEIEQKLTAGETIIELDPGNCRSLIRRRSYARDR